MYFPDIPIYVMNLPERVDRKEHMKNMLASIGVNSANIVVNCENSHNIPMRLKKDVMNRDYLIKNNFITKEASKKLNDAYVANTLGQLDYIKFITISGRSGIIAEDDIMPLREPNDMGTILEQAISELPEDADMLFLEMCYENCRKITRFSKTLYKLHSPSCSAAILYTVNGARNMLHQCLPIFGGIDHMLPDLIRRKKISAYGVVGMLFAQDEYYGSDANRKEAELFKKIHRVRAPICAQGIMKEQSLLIPARSTVHKDIVMESAKVVIPIIIALGLGIGFAIILRLIIRRL